VSLRNTSLLIVLSVLVVACVSSNPRRPVDEKEAAAANVRLGTAYLQQGNLVLAKEKLEKAEKQDPRSFEVQYAMALLSEQLRQVPEAEKHYQAALKLAPNNAGVSNAYAVLMCRNGKVDQALKLFDSTMRDPLYPTPWVASTNAAICLRSDKRNADAIPYLEHAIQLRPDYVAAVLELGDLHLGNNKPELARPVVDRFLSIGRKSADVLFLGVRVALAQGDRSAADVYARLLRRDFPDSGPTRALPQLMQGAAAAPRP
jgi:type IV pilus assembly protein PilF